MATSDAVKPSVTIGLPVRNGALRLERVLGSILAQSRRDFVLCISDNASEDATAQICADYAARDPRIRYIRQNKKISALANFRFALMTARTPFFCWSADDDFPEPEFLEANLAALNACPRAVLSSSRVDFVNNGQFVRHSDSTYPLDGTVRENLAKYLECPGDNSRFYGVFRTDVLKKSFPDRGDCCGMDLLPCALSLLYGHHVEVERVLLRRQVSEQWKYMRYQREHGAATLRSFPVLRVSAYLLSELPRQYRYSALIPLLMRNVVEHVDYVSYHSATGRVFWQSLRRAGVWGIWSRIYGIARPNTARRADR